MSTTKPKTKLSKGEREEYKNLSDTIGGVVLQLGYNALECNSLNALAGGYNDHLKSMQEKIKLKYGCKGIDFKNNKLIY